MKKNMKAYKPSHYMDFSWQMCYANEFLDLNWFLTSESYLQMKQLTEQYMVYKNDPMNSYILEYWKKRGIKKSYYPCDIENVKSRREAHHYSVLGPMEITEEKYPVVYFCHGGGQDSFDAEAYGMAERIQDDKFFYVSPNQYGHEEFERILDEMKKNHYPIDESRVYVFGFSGGSGSAIDIAIHCSKKVAGVAVIPGPNAFNQMEIHENQRNLFLETKTKMPLICIGGNCDGGDRWPLVDFDSYANLNFWMENISNVYGYHRVDIYEAQKIIGESKSKVQQQFGMKFQKEYMDEVDDTFAYIGDYLLEDGATIARFCSVAGLPHGIFPMFSGIAWSFLNKFSRNQEGGELQYKKQEMDFRTRRKGKK